MFWPCILKLDGDDELIYLRSETEFKENCCELILSDDDRVIDSTGASYLLTDELTLVKTKTVLTVADITLLIRSHEFKKAEMCLTKINFLTILDAIQSLR